jgi:hypothetical protein
MAGLWRCAEPDGELVLSGPVSLPDAFSPADATPDRNSEAATAASAASHQRRHDVV